jgi:hypothetical protein
MSAPEIPATLPEALVRLQAGLPEIKKTETADVATKAGSYSYTYAGLAGISSQILPLLASVGLAFVARPTFSGERFVLACSLLHISGQREDAEYPLPTSGTPQALGSAITYGRRYCLCSMTGVAPEDDDDGATAQAESEAKRGTAQRRTRATQPAPRTQRAAPTSEPPPLPNENAAQMSKAERGALMAAFADLGITDRAERLKVSAEIVGRELNSANDLTADERQQVIAELQVRKAEPDPDENGGSDGD